MSRRRASKKFLTLLALTGAAAALYLNSDLRRTLIPDADEAVITKIVDGDTFEISYVGRIEKVRLIGIDTPESRANPKARRDSRRSGKDVETLLEQGRRARSFVERTVRVGDAVRVELDVQERDKYGRLLAYLYLPDGRMLNEEIIGQGYASPMTYPPNVRYEDRFLSAYRAARNARLGLWK